MEDNPALARPLGWCLHAIGLLLILAPLLDLAAGIGSLSPAEVPWRFGAAGLLSGALVLPMLGLGLILVGTVVLEQYGVTRTVGVLAILLLVAVVAVTVSFGLDSLQLRAQIRQDAKRAFDLAAIKAVATYGLEVFVLAVLAVNARRAVRASKPGLSARREGATIVGSKGEA